MLKKKTWIASPREDRLYTILHYGEKDSDGIVVPEGSVVVEHDNDSRSRWVTSNGCKGPGDDLSQSMLAVETFVRLSEEGKL